MEAATMPLDQEVNHIVGGLQDLLSRARIKVPTALCGASLIAEPGEPDLGPDAPVCPDCRLRSAIPGYRSAGRKQLSDRLRADRRKWAQARSLADVGELTAQWLEGKILHQSGYCDPELVEEPGPDPETRELVPLLAACCRYGYVTTSSQPGSTDRRTGQPDQRAAVEGVCGPACAPLLVALALRAGLIVRVFDPAHLPRWRSRHDHAVTVTLDQGCPFTRFGAERSRLHLRSAVTGYGECHRSAVREITGAWQVTIIDPEWGRNDVLWPVLERFAQVTP